MAWNYAQWHLAKQSPQLAKHFNFVRRNRLARIVRFYANLQNYINYIATKEIAPLEESAKQTRSCERWKSEVVFNRLPAELKDEPHQARRLAAFLRKKLRAAKREIAAKNYLKLDFTLSDLSAFVAISGALLLLLGFARIAILGTYFGIPFAQYFGTTDYIASGVGEIYAYVAGALVATLASLAYLATATAVSLQAIELQRRTWSGCIRSWVWHFTGASAVVAAAVVVLRDNAIDATLLGVALTYVGVLIIAEVSARFFTNPLKGWTALTLVFASAVATLVGTISEARRIEYTAPGEPHRVIRFTDATFNQPPWKIFAITNNFVILRRQIDGLVIVKNKSDLRSIEDQPKPAS